MQLAVALVFCSDWKQIIGDTLLVNGASHTSLTPHIVESYLNSHLACRDAVFKSVSAPRLARLLSPHYDIIHKYVFLAESQLEAAYHVVRDRNLARLRARKSREKRRQVRIQQYKLLKLGKFLNFKFFSPLGSFLPKLRKCVVRVAE